MKYWRACWARWGGQAVTYMQHQRRLEILQCKHINLCLEMILGGDHWTFRESLSSQITKPDFSASEFSSRINIIFIFVIRGSYLCCVEVESCHCLYDSTNGFMCPTEVNMDERWNVLDIFIFFLYTVSSRVNVTVFFRSFARDAT